MADRSKADQATYQVIVRSSRPGTAAARGIQALQQGLDAATERLGDLYAAGARRFLTRKERLEDRLAERQARRHAGRTHSSSQTSI